MEPRGSALTIVTHLSWQQLLGLLLLPIALWLLWQLWVVAALLLLALIVAVGLNPAVAWVETQRISRISAVLGLYALILVILGGLGYVVGQVLVIQARSFMTILPELMRRWQAVFDTNVLLARLGAAPDWLTGLSVRAAGYAGLAVQGVVAGLLVLLIAFYLSLDGPHFWQKGVCLVPGEHRAIVEALGRELANKIRSYLRGVALSGLAVAILTGTGLAVLGVPYALLFGVLAGFLEVIPFLGPLLAAIGPITLGLAQSPVRALLVAVFFVAVQQIEDKVLVPRLQAHTTGLHPLTVILALLILGSLFGFLGVVLAVPLAAAGQALIVCVVSCFYHPEGTQAWLAERRPDLALRAQQQEI